MKRKVVVISVLFLLISVFVVYFLMTKRITVESGLSFIFNGLNPSTEYSNFYNIDEKASLQMLKEVGFSQTDLEIVKLKDPPEKIGVVYKNKEGKVLLSSSVASNSRNTIVWSLYISPEFTKIKIPNMSDSELKNKLSQSATNIALMSFINYSQVPNRDAFILFPPEKRQILISFP